MTTPNVQAARVIPMAKEQEFISSGGHLGFCPICHSPNLAYRFINQGVPIAECENCDLLLTNPQTAREIQLKEKSKYKSHNPLRATTFQFYFDQLERYCGVSGGRLLLFDAEDGGLYQEAVTQGFDTTKLEFSMTLERDLTELLHQDRLFDVCMIVYSLEKVADPIDILTKINAALKPDGVLLIVTPSLDSWSAKLLKKNWPEFRPENQFYFDYNTIRNALYKASFRDVLITAEKRLTNLKSIQHRLSRFRRPKLAALTKIFNILFPFFGSERELTLAASGMLVMARPYHSQSTAKLSVVLPVFNEKRTFSMLMKKLIQKEIADLEIEIVIVESNSTDGTRADVIEYRDHPRVKVILQDRPKGKGFAVRSGLEHITGDYVLIQDADLEYDLNDYDVLIQPLINHQRNFVIGSRHSGDGWKIRQFNETRILAKFFNLGHIVFLLLLNLFYNQKLKDPFSMFKVFYRDCIHGLVFECNRFDFDFELVIKLIRNGCKPFEIPVNYHARSFKEGKKVSMLRDPLTWIRALVKYRFTQIRKES